MTLAPTLAALRPAVAVAMTVVVLAGLSSALGFRHPPLMLLWLPGPFVLATMLARGGSTPIAALLGTLGWALLGGATPLATVGYVGSTVVAPVLAAMLVRHSANAAASVSPMQATIRLIGAILFVHAPLAGLADALGAGRDLIAGLTFADHWLAFAAIHAMSASVLVRALLALMPDARALLGAGETPDRPEPPQAARPIVALPELVCHGVLVAAGILAQACGTAGLTATARLMLSAAFIVPVVAALVLDRRAASRVLIAAVVGLVGIRVGLEPFSTQTAFLTTIAQTVVLLTFAGVALHLLNASAAERADQRRQLETMALTHESSGMPNGRALQKAIDARRTRPGAEPFRLAELVVADISSWSDLAGRSRLAALEQRIGEHLAALFEDAAIIAHIGTGRFVLLLPAHRDDPWVRAVIDRGFNGYRIDVDGESMRLRCSIGLVDCDPSDGFAGEALLVAVSMAQQQAAARPDRFCSIGSSVRPMQAYREHLQAIALARRAIEQGRLVLLAQPIVPADERPALPGTASAATGAANADATPTAATATAEPSAADDRCGTLHYEVLARLLDDAGREVSPALFLPALAQARLLEEFDRLVVAKTLATLASDAALRGATGLCAINITGPTLADPRFPDYVARLLDDHGIAPERISFEITESDSIANLESARRNVARLVQMGLAIAVDDFGTGFATFDYLRKFTPRWLKIDGSFVREFNDAPLSREIILSVVRVAHAVGARTVAECVENPEIAARMAGLGVDYLQGWAIARPMPIADLVRFAARRDARHASVRHPATDSAGYATPA